MPSYQKLVRDQIPTIIKESGRIPLTHVLSQEEYLNELDRKLKEEVNEYDEDKSLEEMADVLEVLHAIAIARGYTLEQLEEKRKQKAEERGKFQDRIYLEGVEE